MSMERSRRDRFSTHRVPLTWEVPTAVLLATLFCGLCTPLVVQGVVGLATTGEWAWPTDHLIEAYAGLLQGHFGHGLPHGLAAALPPDRVMWALTVIGEVLVLGAVVVVGFWLRELAGADSRHGLAASSQAAEALGLPRLRKTAAVVRPDLYARTGRDGIHERTPRGSEGSD